MHDSPLGALAAAGLDVEDLARGVAGRVDFTIDYDTPPEKIKESIDEIVRGLELFRSGWTRVATSRFVRRPEIVHLGFKRGKLRAEITLVRFLGFEATFEVR